MNWTFQSPKDFKDFGENLSTELRSNGKIDIAEDLKKWTTTFFTTSSEFLGELRILLKRVLNECDNVLSEDFKRETTKAIHIIDKAFGN